MQDLVQMNHVLLQYPQSKFKLGPIELSIPRGQVLGVLGQNGAGKSTLFQLLTGNLKANQGDIYIYDQKMQVDRVDLKRQIGYLPQSLDLPKWVSGEELLTYAIRLYELDQWSERLANSLRYWDCDQFSKKPLAACSHGMQKRVALALATIHSPNILILDEPFSGLDLYHIKALQDLIQQRQTENQITILSTHIAPYAAELCNQVVLIREGQLQSIPVWSQSNHSERLNLIEAFFFQTTEHRA